MSSGNTSTRHIQIRYANPEELIPADYGTTPGGTIFSTTPHGTRIVYNRRQLLDLQHSPLSQTPPLRMNPVPGVTGSQVQTTGRSTGHDGIHLVPPGQGGPSVSLGASELGQPKFSMSNGMNFPGFRAPPNTPANKLALPTHLTGPTSLSKMADMKLEEMNEEEEPHTPTTGGDKGKFLNRPIF
ncbi:Eukaryotic translation initiation factor 4E-binding protein 2 [Dispira simplex]|nr:Eukaryotic translation initiation factor 4E-binding protein 2 [Dispira simplex]